MVQPVGEKGARPVVLADVARAVGVSTATVSYVLNGTPGHSISLETQQRVRAQASKLGYDGARLARSRRKNGPPVVVLETSGVIGYGARSAAEAFSTRLHVNGIRVIAHPLPLSPLTLIELVDLVLPTAVVAMGTLSADLKTSLHDLGVQHLICYDFRALGAGRGWDRAFGEKQVLHLAARGHRHVAYAHPPQKVLRPSASLRALGAASACEEFGMARPVEFVSEDDDVARLYTLARLHANHPEVTAVAAYDDDVAAAILHSLRQMCLVPPAKMAVMGVDDIPVARHLVPALTTIRVDASKTGARMAQKLLEGLGFTRPSSGSFDPEITVVSRDSA